MREDFVGAGWAFPVGVDTTGRIALARGERDIEQAIQLILRTYPGERPMRAEFGSRLRDYVFDGANGDNAAEIADEVSSALLRWEPRIVVEDVVVTPDQDDPSILYIEIQYTIKATNDPRNLVFPFYTIPRQESEPA
ncbi:MAG TPA: GPW/gp25 family protein [Pseudonocardiaceae bacterium]|nr:GPW/gp25 family protein [Pseudonocardiaceae bacterium]